MLTNTELKINFIAQGIINKADGISWFKELPTEQRTQVLYDLAHICCQSHPKKEEVLVAITRAHLKPTFTPCVLLKLAKIPEKGLRKIATLPESEQIKSFRLMLALFSIADARRRATDCKDGCSHEWHNLR